MTRDLGQAPDRPGEAGGRGETDEARGPSPGRQARKPHRRLGDGAGVPHSQPANRPPRHGMGKPEAGHPEGLGLPRAPADPRPALNSPQPRAAPRARASQQPRRRQHHCRHLVSPPTALSSLPVPPPAPRPPGSLSRRSASRFRCAERKQRLEARSGGRAAGDGGGRLGPRPGRSRGHGAAAAGLRRAGAAESAAMAGYARRPGVTPLSRARSLVIPDGERARGGRAAAARRPR